MTKLLQTMVMLLVALMMPMTAATALAQRVTDSTQAGSMSYMPSNYNAQVNSHPVMAPVPGPFLFLDKNNVRIHPNQSLMLTVGFYSSTGATALKVMSSNNSVATARVVDGNVQILGLMEGTAIITVASHQRLNVWSRYILSLVT